MIEEKIHENKKNKYKCRCDICNKQYNKENDDKYELGNTSACFCDDCEKLFIDWLIANNYKQHSCWCSHIQEYKDSL